MATQSLPTIRLATSGGSVVCERCEVALTLVARLRRSLEPGRGEGLGTGLLEKPATWTHTLFGRRSVDVVFLDRDLRVVRVVAHLPPWRLTTCARASAVVTLPSGQAGRQGVQLGLRLVSNPAATT